MGILRKVESIYLCMYLSMLSAGATEVSECIGINRSVCHGSSQSKLIPQTINMYKVREKTLYFQIKFL